MYKILIIDDEPANIDTMINALMVSDYEVLIATNGKLGLDVAFNTHPDLIITDWEMPELDGIEVINVLKNDERTKLTPVIMATGKMTSNENLAIALQAGAVDFIRKPIDTIELKARVSSMLLLYRTMQQNIQLQTQMFKLKEAALEKEIAGSRCALAEITLRLIHNSELNAKILNRLKDISQHTDNIGNEILNQLISEIRTDLQNINWTEFNILFEQVHKQFYETLIFRFPNLTASERKLMIFYKLNMNSKDICTLTYQNENSLKKARQRLRKKLMMNDKDSISDFVNQL